MSIWTQICKAAYRTFLRFKAEARLMEPGRERTMCARQSGSVQGATAEEAARGTEENSHGLPTSTSGLLAFAHTTLITVSAMALNLKLAQNLRRLATQWPSDPLRPNLQLKTFLVSLADHPNLTAPAVSAVRALQNNTLSNKVRSLIFPEWPPAGSQRSYLPYSFLCPQMC